MRPTFLAAAAFVLILSGSGSAQEFTEFASCEFRVGANFPGQPVARDVSYRSVNDASVRAREFSAQSGAGRFVLTAVDFTGNRIDMQQAFAHARDALRRKGRIIFGANDRLEDNIPAAQFSIAEPGGGRLLATIYMYDRRLYVMEAATPAGVAPTGQAVQFVQSIMILDATGREVDPAPDASRYQAANC
jgi:hypothetical protein